jgi:FKBP-type peptidyl-prolyl cis-trans isomerase
MKKIVAIGCGLAGILFLAGCSQPQVSQSQQQSGQAVPPPNPVVQSQPAQSQPEQTPANNSANNSNNTMTTPDGLKIETTQPGTGTQAVKSGDTVSVQYTGTLTDGTKFDSTADHGGQPFSFTVGAGQVIKGWDEGLIGMKVGEKRTLTIPPSLGYGATGAGDSIPPNATLIFDIQLVSIQ